MKPLKPDYDSKAVQAKLVKEVCDYFGRVFDDDEQERHSMLRGHRPGDEVWSEIILIFVHFSTKNKRGL